MRDIPEFEMGFITNGAGDEVHDIAVAFSAGGDERELRLEGEDASGIMPRIVSALNAHDDLLAALKPFAQVVDNDEDGWPDTAGIGNGLTFGDLRAARAAIAKATA